MNRRMVTQIAQKLGGKIIHRTQKITVYQFATEENLYAFKDQISYHYDAMIGGQGTIDSIPPITVRF